MALQKFIVIHLLWFKDYIMIEKTLLNKARESKDIFMQKVEKDAKQFINNRFVKEAKEDL